MYTILVFYSTPELPMLRGQIIVLIVDVGYAGSPYNFTATHQLSMRNRNKNFSIHLCTCKVVCTTCMVSNYFINIISTVVERYSTTSAT